ncbi:MAG: ATP-dependent DNA helicase RecG [bacterium]|nr:ATP-dependent DNA helicase RecG [bacterium]
MDLGTPIAAFPRIGKTTAVRLKKLGLLHLEDLLFYFPFRYDDFSRIVPIIELKAGEVATIEGVITMIGNRRTSRSRKIITEVLIADDTGIIRVVWFNQPFLIKNLAQGDRVRIAGKMDETFFGIQFTSPSYEKIRSDVAIHTGRLVPIYPLTEGIAQRQIRTLIQQALPLIDFLPEIIPQKILTAHALIGRGAAIRSLHFPENNDAFQKAHRRMAFEELFVSQLRTRWARQTLDKSTALTIPFNEQGTKTFVTHLPFAITHAQRTASWEVLKDIQKTRPMNRLVNGEVGSGKTAVAAIAAFNAASAGVQTVVLAPTEILASQHAHTFMQFFSHDTVTIGLLTRTQHQIITAGELRESTSKELKKSIADGTIQIIIGTHAVLQKDVQFKNLGLITIDEQHRFGVEQRAALTKMAEPVPHLLSMTATPIPRSLALTFYGDLDLSVLDELPAGRAMPKTWVVSQEKRDRAYQYLKRQLTSGRQGFVICPLIDPSDTLGVRSATQEYERLQRDVFPELRLGLLHGKLKSAEKHDTMQQFRDGAIHLLISTSVVEVGVDVPNATLMIIEDAERFGFAQLHQFRGRIARGKIAGECFVFTGAENGPGLERLQEFSRTTDGFKLAERDLELRGPGAIIGTQQSGFPEFKIADFTDVALVKAARDAATELLTEDTTLAFVPALKALVTAGTLPHLE